MKFKKFLGAVCSFLLATTSLFCGGPASAKDPWGNNNYVFMVNSGEDLGNGIVDGNDIDQRYYTNIILKCSYFYYKLLNSALLRTKFDTNDCYFTYLNQRCPDISMSACSFTRDTVPDIILVGANLAKEPADVENDLRKHFDNISHCATSDQLFRGPQFSSGGHLHGEKVHLDSVPVIMCGLIEPGLEQKTSDEKFVSMAKCMADTWMREKDAGFRYVHNCVHMCKGVYREIDRLGSPGESSTLCTQKTGDFYCINMNTNTMIDENLESVMKRLVEDPVTKPILCNLDPEAYAQKMQERKHKIQEEKRQAEERRNAEAKRKNILGGTLVGSSVAFIIGSAIFGWVKYNQNKKSEGNKTKVPKPQVQKSQVAASA